MKKKILLLSLSLLLIFLTILPRLAEAWSGTVINVAEGDLLTVLRNNAQVKIRLYGIDTPEKGQPFSEEARLFTSKMVLGKLVEVGAIHVDHQGRTVSLVYAQGKGVGDELIGAGLAWVYYLYCNLPICAEWKNIESQAKEAKRGLWSQPHPLPPWEFKRKKPSQ